MALISPEGHIDGFADEMYDPENGYFKAAFPPGFVDEDFDYLVYSNGVVNVDLSAKQAEALRVEREKAKAERQLAVDQIKVTTQAGNTFDGDETSQTRMSRAIIALSTGLAPSVTWVLADNTTIQATAAELTEALVLAGQAQAALWII